MSFNTIKLIQGLESVDSLNVYTRFRAFLPFLSGAGFFNHLNRWDEDTVHTFVQSLRFLGGSELECGFGLGLAGMAQANIAGNLLKYSKRDFELNELVRGRKIFSVAVSEKGWNSRLSNMKTNIGASEKGYHLIGAKNFATNGRIADAFIVVVKSSEQNLTPYPMIYLPRNTAGLEISSFDLDIAKEATHAELKFRNLELPKENLLPLDYKEHGRYLPHFERFCFHYLLVGLAKRILKEKKLELEDKDWDELASLLDDLEQKLDATLKGFIENGITKAKLRDTLFGRDLISFLNQRQAISKLYPGILLASKLVPNSNSL